MKNLHALLWGCAVLAPLSVCPDAQAAESSETAASEPGDIIVTARKRQESILKVPVIESVITRSQLDTLQITEMTDLARIVPGLNLGNAVLSIGTLVSIRGIGTNSNEPGIDQSVSLNIDGLSLGNGLAFASGLFDVGQIEVLKGPQALFYGKSSPGGVVSLRTADPTDETEVIGRIGFEAESEQPRAELIVSGPISPTLKLRLASTYAQQEGYFRNRAAAMPGTGAGAPSHDRAPNTKSLAVRGTMLWNPSPDFSARLKVNFVHDRALVAEAFQFTSCPEGPGPVPGVGIPFIGGGEDCKLDRTQRTVYLDPANFPGLLNNGVPFVETDQRYGSLELNYQLGKDLLLSSTTGYYNARSKSMVNASEATFAGPFIAAQNHFRRRLFTEEVRLTSDFSGPLNFMLGGLYEDGFFSNHAEILGNSAYKLAPRFADGLIPVDVRTYSAFGQLRWRIVPELELAGGLRWTDEKRSEAPFNYLTNRAVAVPVPVLRARNVAPEFTLTYTPTDDLTLFAAAKQNYKSGSFNVGTPASPGLNNAFRDERVRGAEVGLKSRLLDRQLALNVAGYYYRYKNLQVGARTPVSDGVPRIVTLNAASAKTYGVDFDAAFRPAGAEGLSLNLAINWNLGRYLNFDNAPCYGGQLASEGCDQLFNPLVDAYTAQDLSGTPLVRAPKWHANFGFSYERQIARDAKLILTNSNEFSSRYATFLAVGRPHDDNYQRRFLKTDLSLAVRTLDDRLEFAVIGKNISDKVTTGACTSANNAAGTILPNPSGGTERGPAGLDEVGCFAERGREVWLRLTWKPFGKGSNR